MDTFRVCLRTYDREGCHEPPEFLFCGPSGIDTVSLGEFYSGQGTAAEKAFERFLILWNDPECQKAMTPGACIAFVPPSILSADILSGLHSDPGGREERMQRNIRMAAASVWTLGGGIDGCINGHLPEENHLAGMILDVAAAQTLVSMHRILRSLIRRESISRFALFPVREICPGVGGVGMGSIPELITLTGADSELDVCHDKGVMRPLRSRCSLILLSDDPPDVELAELPCEPCQGEKCLYRQIGGCQFLYPARETGREKSGREQ